MNVIAQGYRVIEVDPIPEEDALVKGVEFISEFILFSCAGGILIYEYIKNETKNQLKSFQENKAKEEFLKTLNGQFDSIEVQLSDIKSRLEKLEQANQIVEKEKNNMQSSTKLPWMEWIFHR